MKSNYSRNRPNLSNSLLSDPFHGVLGQILTTVNLGALVFVVSKNKDPA